MKRLSRICAAALLIAVIGLTSQSYLWARDIKLHDINSSVVDSNKIDSIDSPRKSPDGNYWVLTIFLKSSAGPMAIIFQYPSNGRNSALNDYKLIRREI